MSNQPGIMIEVDKGYTDSNMFRPAPTVYPLGQTMVIQIRTSRGSQSKLLNFTGFFSRGFEPVTGAADIP